MDHGSFFDRHPVIAIALLIGFVIFAGAPAIPMLSERVACKIGASDLWCPPNSKHHHLRPETE